MHVNLVTQNYGDSIQAVFNINILILDIPTWLHPSSILSQIKTIKKCNSSFFYRTTNKDKIITIRK